MRYIDTSVLIKVITGDNPILAQKAIAEIECCGQNELCILDAILVEVCFVLEFHDYKMTRTDIATALQTLLATPQIFTSNNTIRTLEMYSKFPKLDYADCLLAVMGGKHGILTFDSDLLKSL